MNSWILEKNNCNFRIKVFLIHNSDARQEAANMSFNYSQDKVIYAAKFAKVHF